ncbi:FAD-binding oxidoreductase [Thalassovita sp.]|uniref:FAD-binding oxidoreductase n=1 Tax=Thalassovita sp. TaxID=1979401 RepID=UPI002AAF9DC5|nr:FAD-binding oxidoreductase [Thalassovita sp.]
MDLNAVTPAFLDALRADLDARCFRDVTPNYLEEPRGRWQGQAGAVLAPGSVEEVSLILKAAHAARVPVVPYGGGTGLVGGQVMGQGPAPIILSLERMTKVRACYAQENVLVVEAGAILQDIHAVAAEHDRLFPMSIAAKGSARIGGCLATNAGGVNVLRYGNTRDLVLGIEAVLPDGQIWNGLSRLRKDNTGYDLKNLMIGSEGSLGVITAAALKLSPIPAGQGTAVMVVETPAAALELLSLARSHMGEAVSAFELIHRQGLDFMAEHLPDLRQPLAEVPEWSVLIDVGLARGLDPSEALETLFVEAAEAGLVSDGVIAQNEQQRHELWEMREQIPEANRLVGSISSHDISLPLSRIAEFITEGWAALTAMGDVRVNCFGHLGDGNLHFNVFPAAGKSRADYLDIRDAIKTCVHDMVARYDGSVSAEHGIGRLKVADLEKYGDPVKLALMRQIKDAFDPQGIMNPGAVLRAE